jgi:acyloxyacyl hydrolase
MARLASSDSHLFCLAEKISQHCPVPPSKDKDQTLCAVCVVVLQVVENYAKIHGWAYEKIVDAVWCS